MPGTVILNKHDYLSKMEGILNDRNKFEMIGTPDYYNVFKSQDKINRFLRSLRKDNIINETTYQELYSTGSSYGILYGLPKIHKPGLPLRPILASFNTPNYKLAKFLVPILEPLTKNSYSLNNSLQFKESILLQDSDLYMTSLDIESLFTNIPVGETIELILNKLFPDPESTFNHFNRTLFKTLLELAVLDTAFVFNGKLFKQVDGMAMGSPLGPKFANIFMCSLEERMLDDCPLRFHPLFYSRYVDDTFVLFKGEYEADLFLDYVNTLHPNMKFTIEKEENNCLSFLDVQVYRQDNSFNTTIFRKKTFTGLGSNFYSSCYFNFKINSIFTLLNRALVLSSNWNAFHNEILFLVNFFKGNCFPPWLVYKKLNQLLNKHFSRRPVILTVPKMNFYATFPYISDLTFQKRFTQIIHEHFPAISVKLIPKNPLTIGSLFKIKDQLCPYMSSGVIYKYTCPKCISGIYVGSTSRLLKVRIDSHRGVSFRTGSRISNPEHSNIRNHSKQCKTYIENKYFNVIGHTASPQDLTILESLFIKLVPSLNTHTSAS